MSMTVNEGKYVPFKPVDIKDRHWPDQTIDEAPIWCAVDLRDGNQALIEPMGAERKRRMWDTLVKIGFKEIEVGFPSASQTDFDFARTLIEEDLIPDDVTIQVLTQAREHLIERTFEAIAGAKRAIVHLYNSTSTAQRKLVFQMDRAGIVDIAVQGAELVRKLGEQVTDTELVWQYSPESFTGTELDFSKEICDAVTDVFEPTPDRPMIINLPSTVELSTPNIYADQIEWMHRNLNRRDSIVLSLHTHNDRGCGVAATELGVMAGAQRVEGTLFGNGERTGNVDLVTLALNLYTQGVDPKVELTDIDAIRKAAEYCNQLPVHPRHPYAGELVFTAFSGSHQDAIRKGLNAKAKANDPYWEVPYLPIDPNDVGRTYEAVIRVNSQSGKGGIAYVMESDFGIVLPRSLQIDLSGEVQKEADRTGEEMVPSTIWRIFEETYLAPDGRFAFIDHKRSSTKGPDGKTGLTVSVEDNGAVIDIEGSGTGPIDAYVDAIKAKTGLEFRFADFNEHAIGSGAHTEAIAFVEIRDADDQPVFGAGKHADIVRASLHAVTAAVNRLLARN